MTSADRQARRREQFRQMREALERIAQARTIREARAIAAETLAALARPTGATSGATCPGTTPYKARGDMSGDKG